MSTLDFSNITQMVPPPPRYVCVIFTHDYLFPIGRGIQSMHAALEMVNKYTFDTWKNVRDEDGPRDEGFIKKQKIVKDYISLHKTSSFRKGGFSKKLSEIRDAARESNLPWSEFYEDEETLGRLLTSVAVIIDYEQYGDAVDLIRQKHYLTSASPDSEFVTVTPSFPPDTDNFERVERQNYNILCHVAKQSRAE